MKKSELQNLRRYAGDLSGLYGMLDFTFNEGNAKGMRAIQLSNGKGLSAVLLPDRCLDIPFCNYKGVNLGLVLNQGLCAPGLFSDDDGRGFNRQFYGGLLTTCGLFNAGPPCEDDGRMHAMHGRIHNIPGENINKEEITDGDDIVLQVSAEMREASLFGEHVVLMRQIKMETESNRLIITDTVENRGFEPVPLCILYHFNFGYPLLDSGAKLHFSTTDVEPRNETAAAGLSKYNLIEEPEMGRPEECFIHTGGTGMQFGMLHNEKLGMAVAVHYNIDELPLFCQWKNMMSGDYALGLEPSAAGFYGLKNAREKGLVRFLESGKSQSYEVCIEVIDDSDRISGLATQCE